MSFMYEGYLVLCERNMESKWYSRLYVEERIQREVMVIFREACICFSLPLVVDKLVNLEV
jgi:hypothetical protein